MVLDEKNRSGPQSAKLPPCCPNLAACPNDFSLGSALEITMVIRTCEAIKPGTNCYPCCRHKLLPMYRLTHEGG